MSNCLKKFKTLDLFGQPVSLNYRGSTSYQTKLGALFSLIFMIVIGGVAIYRLEKLFLRKDPKVN